MIYFTNDLSRITGNCLCNCVVFETPKGSGYVVVDTNTFEQACMIKGRLNRTETVIANIKGSLGPNWSLVPGIRDFLNSYDMPKPLDMLQPFILLLCKEERANFTNLTEKDMYGILNQMSLQIDFNAYLLQPEQVRANIHMPFELTLAYQPLWDNLELTKFVKLDKPFIAPVVQPYVPAPTNNDVAPSDVQTHNVTPTPAPAPTPVEESKPAEEEEAPDWDSMFNSFLAEAQKEHEDMSKKVDSSVTAKDDSGVTSETEREEIESQKAILNKFKKFA